MRRKQPLVVLGSLSAALAGPAPAAADDAGEGPAPSTLKATAIAPASAPPRGGAAEVQLDARWLPVESRTDVRSYVGLNVPGASLAPEGAGLEIRGGVPRDTATSVDDFRIAPLLLPPGALGGADVYTAGHGADLADVPGGAIAVRAHTPSNRLRAAADAYHDIRDPERNAGNATVSGPLLRDRLFALVSLNGALWTKQAAADPDGVIRPPPPAASEAFSGAVKLRWHPHARHSVESLTIIGAEETENGGALGVEQEAQPTVGSRAIFSALTWRGALTDRFSLRSQVGFLTTDADLEPMLCRRDPAGCELVAPMIHRFGLTRTVHAANGPLRARWRSGAWEVVNGAELRGRPVSWASHQARLTSRVIFRDGAMSESIPAGHLDEHLLGAPERRTELVEGPGWARADAASMRTVHSLEERVGLWDRLWITPGLALVTSRVETPEGSVLQDVAVTPHLGAAWDATGDQRTWLRASVHRRVGTQFEDVTTLAPGMAARRTCLWDPDTSTYSRLCAVNGGASGRTLGLPCGANNVGPDGSPCAVAPRLPTTWELTVGGGREIARNLTLDLDVVQRRAAGLPGVRETNRLWDAAGENVLGYQTARRQPIDDWSTAGTLGRRYLGVTAALEKRAGRFRAVAAYSWSRLAVDLAGGRPELGGLTAAPGEAEGTFHGLRALAVADVLGAVSLGLIYSYDKGALYQTTVTGDPQVPSAGYRARTGVNPGPNPNDPGDERPVGRRFDELQRLNLQLRARAGRLLPVDVDVYLDVINLLDFGAVLLDPSGPTFATAYRIQEPRWFRVGLEGRY